MKYFCNPLNIDYRYQFNMDPRVGKLQVCREAADPSMILFKGKYYIFASMQLKVWVSEDLAHWESYKLPEELPLYDYAPDVCVRGDYVYFCASRREEKCDYYRTKDIINGPYEKIEGTFPFWDPHVFPDDDGKMYFYWGCSNSTPIYGVEVDPETMAKIGEVKELIKGHPFEFGYERVGYDNSRFPRSEEEIEKMYQGFVKKQGIPEEYLPANVKPLIRGMFSDKPYIEGAWMTKYEGNYYLQYATPGTQYNTYGDGVYVGKSPLGPFEPAKNNPYSYKPGGFMTGAGHGSTMKDKEGRYWHTSTMQISIHHDFERRVGLWRAGFDEDGELYCNQRYGDWPMDVSKEDPWAEPEWMLLSYGKKMTASSYFPGNNPENAADENARTWWKANSGNSGEWLVCDLGEEMDVHAVQINFADDKITDQKPAGEIRGTSQARWIDDRPHKTRWILECSNDGNTWNMPEDKSGADTDLPHDLVVREEGFAVRYLKLTVLEVPMNEPACISGFRVFGKGNGEKPEVPEFEAVRTNDLDMTVEVKGQAEGWNILWGNEPEKLYHSCMTYKPKTRIGALVKGKEYYVRVDAYNENGITHGKTVKL